MRLKDAITEFMTYVRARDMSPNTIRNYDQDMRAFAEYAGNPRIDIITPSQIDDYVIYLREHISPRTGRPLAPKTINKRLTVLKVFFNLMLERRYIDANPAAHIRVHTIHTDPGSRTIPLDDLRKTLEYIQHHTHNRERNMYMVIALADSGMRVSEVAGLRISDIDTGNHLAHICRKGRKHQIIPISSTFLWAYDAWMRVRPETDHDYVLVRLRGTPVPLSAPSIAQRFRYLSERATGRAWGPHSIRHAWLSEALNNAGIQPKIAQDIAGHNDIETTIRYVRPDFQAQRAAIESGPLLTTVLPVDTGPMAVTRPVV